MRPRHAARGRHRRPRRRWAALLLAVALAGTAWVVAPHVVPEVARLRAVAVGDATGGGTGSRGIATGGGTGARDHPTGARDHPTATTACAPRETGDGTRATGGSTRDARAVDVLRRWDAARAQAYATGSPAALRRLYEGDAGASDVRILQGYLGRGYRVEDLCMQLLDVRVLRHTSGVLTLRVTDRLAHAVAVGHGERIELPRDRAGTRTVRLVRGADGRWRVARVRG